MGIAARSKKKIRLHWVSPNHAPSQHTSSSQPRQTDHSRKKNKPKHYLFASLYLSFPYQIPPGVSHLVFHKTQTKNQVPLKESNTPSPNKQTSSPNALISTAGRNPRHLLLIPQLITSPSPIIQCPKPQPLSSVALRQDLTHKGDSTRSHSIPKASYPDAHPGRRGAKRLRESQVKSTSCFGFPPLPLPSSPGLLYPSTAGSGGGCFPFPRSRAQQALGCKREGGKRWLAENSQSRLKASASSTAAAPPPTAPTRSGASTSTRPTPPS